MKNLFPCAQALPDISLLYQESNKAFLRKRDLMRSDVVVGYQIDGQTFCEGCADTVNDDQPIFAGDEYDEAPTCDECGDDLEVSLSGDGENSQDLEDSDLEKEGFEDITEQEIPDSEEIPEAKEDEIEDDLDAMNAEALED